MRVVDGWKVRSYVNYIDENKKVELSKLDIEERKRIQRIWTERAALALGYRVIDKEDKKIS